MADGDELWELAVTVPPVTEDIRVLHVRCGATTVEVRDDEPGWWHVRVGDWPKTESHQDYARAVEDAYRLARAEERRRLLERALADVLVEFGDDEPVPATTGEGHGEPDDDEDCPVGDPACEGGFCHDACEAPAGEGLS